MCEPCAKPVHVQVRNEQIGKLYQGMDIRNQLGHIWVCGFVNDKAIVIGLPAAVDVDVAHGQVVLDKLGDLSTYQTTTNQNKTKKTTRRRMPSWFLHGWSAAQDPGQIQCECAHSAYSAALRWAGGTTSAPSAAVATIPNNPTKKPARRLNPISIRYGRPRGRDWKCYGTKKGLT